MENLSKNTSLTLQKKNRKRKSQLTSSGRESKTPRYLLTTSEEDRPKIRSIKTMTSVSKEKENLRALLLKIQLNKSKSGDKVDNNVNKESKNKSQELKETAPTTSFSSEKNLSHEQLKGTPQYTEQAKPAKPRGTQFKLQLEKKVDFKPRKSLKVTNPPMASASEKEFSVLTDFVDQNDDEASGLNNLVEKNPGDARVSINSVCENVDDTSTHIHSVRQIDDDTNETNTSIWQNYNDTSTRIHSVYRKDGDSNPDSCYSKNTPNKFEKEILERLRIIEQQNNQILEHILQNSPSEAVSNKLFEPLAGFPLENIEDYHNLNAKENMKLRKKLLNYLKSRGGTKLREFLICSLQIIMTDQLISQFTWLGDAKHTKFGDSRVANVLYLAAQKCPYFPGPADKTQFKLEMLEVLRSTKQRFRKSKKKVQKKELLIDVQDENGADNTLSRQELEILDKIERLKEIEHSSESEEAFNDESSSNSNFEADDEMNE